MKLALARHAAGAKRNVGGEFPAEVSPQAGAYFPNSRVASGGTSFVSPVSYADGNPGGAPEDIISLPAGGDSPWVIHNPSDEQGLGRSPGQQWPWKSHSEAYNFEQIAIMPFEQEQTMGMPTIPGGWNGRNPPEKVGWSIPRYYEQYEQWASGIAGPDSLAVTPQPEDLPYTVAMPPLDDGSQAYG